MSVQNSIKSLVELGLTDLESQIYAFLLQNSPATGYGVAKGVGKPTANAYKGLASLSEKGAIIAEESNPRLYRAIPVNELLNSLESRFQKLKKQAEQDLKKLKPTAIDERVYNMNSVDQVFERFRQMIGRAEEILLLDLFPVMAEELKPGIESAIARGVNVVIKLYKPIDLAGAIMIIDRHEPEIIKRWPGNWANGIADGKEYLIALISNDKQSVFQAVWSSNIYLSWVYHSAFMFELMHAALFENGQNIIKESEIPDKYKTIKSLNAQRAPGYSILLERFAENN